jgi:MFS family permease
MVSSGSSPRAAIDSRRGWTVAVGAAVASGTGFGTVYAFGAFFDAMGDDLASGRGAVALVFGVTLFLFFGMGAVSGPLADRFGPRGLALAGAALVSGGLAASSRVDSVVMGYLTYGVGVGLGGSLIATPMFSTTAGWFVRRRALALGVVATGNGLGTLVLVPLAERLIDAHGWRDAFVLLAAIDLTLLLGASLVIARPPVPPPPPAVARMRAVAATPAFRRLFFTGMLFSVALFVAFAFIVDFATAEGVSSRRAALLVGLVGAASVIGRLGLTTLSNRVHAVRLLQACLAAQPVAFALWLAAGGRFGLLVTFAVVLGVAYGGFVALGPEVAAVLFGMSGLGGVMGLMFASAGLGGLIGPALAGWLADATSGRVVPILLSLTVSVLALLLSLTIPARPVEAEPQIARA